MNMAEAELLVVRIFRTFSCSMSEAGSAYHCSFDYCMSQASLTVDDANDCCYMGFPKIRDAFLGVPKMRTNYHTSGFILGSLI